MSFDGLVHTSYLIPKASGLNVICWTDDRKFQKLSDYPMHHVGSNHPYLQSSKAPLGAPNETAAICSKRDPKKNGVKVLDPFEK